VNLHLSVMSLNVNGSKDPAGALHRLRLVAARSAQADARILLLQEVPASLGAQLGEIFPGMEPTTWANEVTEGEPPQPMGLVTLTNLSVQEPGRVSFRNPELTSTRGGTTLASHDKGALLTTLIADPSGPEIIVVNLHALPFYLFDVPDDGDLVGSIWKAFGAELVLELDRPVAPAPATPVLVGGDFNLSDRSAVETALAGLDLRSTFCHVATRPSGGRTDDVYVSTEAVTSDASVEDVGSDHYLLRLELELALS
jgi:hypothetical protein